MKSNFGKLSRISLTIVTASLIQFLPLYPANSKTLKVPQPAYSEGFKTLSFSIDRFDENNFDATSSVKSGYKLYPYNFFYSNIKQYSNVIDNGVMIASGKTSSLATAACSNKKCSDYVGSVFKNGGYIEVEVSYDETKVQQDSGNWPAVWMLPMESVTMSPAFHWLGQAPGYNHGVEVDILEQQFSRKPRRFSSTLHDWYGVYDRSCPGHHYCQFAASRVFDADVAHDYKAFHKVAALWVPASKGRRGSITFYYDGSPIGTPITWEKYVAGKARPPINNGSPWAFGSLDQQHMALIIGSNKNAPIRVKSIHVWQSLRSDAVTR